MYRDEMTDAFLEEAFARAARVRTERLPADDEIPHEFSPRFARRMRAVLREGERPPRVNRVIFLGKRSAAVLVAAAVVAFGAVMSVAAWREAFFDFIEEKFSDHSHVSYRQTGEIVLPETLIKYAPQYIPEGYELVFSDAIDTSYTMYYRNKDGKGIYFDQTRLDTVEYAIDTERHDFEEIEVNGDAARFLPNEEEPILLWENDIYLFVLSGNIDKKELIKMAESTKIKK